MTFQDRVRRGLVLLTGARGRPRGRHPAQAAVVSATPNAAPTFNAPCWPPRTPATRSTLAAFSLASGAVDNGWTVSADDTVESVVVAGSRIYLGGQFDALNGASGTRKIAAVTADGRIDTGFRASADVVVHAIATGASGLYAALGGQGGTLRAYAFDGAGRWSLTMDGDPRAVTVLAGTVYIGGHFDNVCRSARTGDKGTCLDGRTQRVKLAAASEGGGALLSWVADGNGSSGVHTMAASTSARRIVAGGAFTQINGGVPGPPGPVRLS